MQTPISNNVPPEVQNSEPFEVPQQLQNATLDALS